MNNRYHLQLRSKEIPISKIVELINNRNAYYHNTKYCLTGHVYLGKGGSSCPNLIRKMSEVSLFAWLYKFVPRFFLQTVVEFLEKGNFGASFPLETFPVFSISTYMVKKYS